jgi:hypothetical protein
MRALSDRFMGDLLNDNGLLHPILVRVKKDHTLMIAIRESYINIYYRGGNILRIQEQNKSFYRASFDKNYNFPGQELPDSPATITNKEDSDKWVSSFATRKNMMDEYFSKHSKPEREYQQVIARENNDSTISNESEYFISDIEFADSELGARFDLLGIRWLTSQRKNGNKCKAAFMEMKYGDGALEGTSGLLKHLQDFDTFISGNRYHDLLVTMESQFNQLDQLGLLKFNKGTSNAKIKLDVKDRPEVIFILADHNPRSTKLKTILRNERLDVYSQSVNFDLRFFVSSFAGYGLHADCMLDLAEFRDLLNR